jgi:hypothetical protein
VRREWGGGEGGTSGSFTQLIYEPGEIV